METSKKTFAVRDVSRFLIAFGILIMVLNFNQYLIVYLLGIVTLLLGFLNLFSLNSKVKFAGSLNMAVAGIYFVIMGLFLYRDTFGFIGTLVLILMGAVLLIFSARFILYYLSHDGEISF